MIKLSRLIQKLQMLESIYGDVDINYSDLGQRLLSMLIDATDKELGKGN